MSKLSQFAEFTESQLSQIESLLITGDHHKARLLLHQIDFKKLPRQSVSRFADLAWRANEYLLVLKRLRRLIYPASEYADHATAAEKVAFASALSSLGATKEAKRILAEIDADVEPSALFHTAGALTLEWNYKDSIPYLKKYIESKNLSDYRRMVGQINYAASLICIEDYELAAAHLEIVKSKCASAEYLLLLGNCYELLAQLEIVKGDLGKAREYLRQSSDLLKNQNGLYLLFTDKWDMICDCLDANTATEKQAAIEKLASLRQRALSLKHWNTIRECDLYQAFVLDDREILKKVVFGTPAHVYRTRARRLFGSELPAKGKYLLYLGEDHLGSEVPIFDPRKRFGGHGPLIRKSTLFHIFEALCSDFYQPQTIGQIFQVVHPDEKFNPTTSPARVLQAIRRLDEWFVASGLPLFVDRSKSEFKINSRERIAVVVQRGSTLMPEQIEIDNLRTLVGGNAFTIADVCRLLQISRATADRRLRPALKSGAIIKARGARGLRFRFSRGRSGVKVARAG